MHTFINKPNGLKRSGLKAGGDNFVEPTFTCYDETSFIFLLKTSHIWDIKHQKCIEIWNEINPWGTNQERRFTPK